MAETLHIGDIAVELRTAENGDPVRFGYRSSRSGAIRYKSGKVRDSYSPSPAASKILVEADQKQYTIKPDGTVESEKVGTLGTLTRLSID